MPGIAHCAENFDECIPILVHFCTHQLTSLARMSEKKISRQGESLSLCWAYPAFKELSTWPFSPHPLVSIA